MREKCPYLEFFSSIFSRIRAETGETLGQNAGKYGPDKLQDTFHAVFGLCSF